MRCPVSRRPTPTATKRLTGNPGKRALPKPGQEPDPAVVEELPLPPQWLGKHGVEEWYRVGPILIDQHLLTVADLFTFATFCANVDILITAVEEIESEGMVILGARGPVRNPALATFAAATTSVRNMAAEFGMTPSSRARIKLPTDDGPSIADLLGDEEEDTE